MRQARRGHRVGTGVGRGASRPTTPPPRPAYPPPPAHHPAPPPPRSAGYGWTPPPALGPKPVPPAPSRPPHVPRVGVRAVRGSAATGLCLVLGLGLLGGAAAGHWLGGDAAAAGTSQDSPAQTYANARELWHSV